MRSRPVRLLAALALGGALVAVPVATVLACSCGFPGYEEAIASADAAFIGTVVSSDEPPPGAGDGLAEATYLFEVSATKAELPDRLAVVTPFGGGANCGFDMSVGEEWLVIVAIERGQPRTNLCHGTVPIEGLDAETRAIVVKTLTLPDPSAPVHSSSAAVPAGSARPSSDPPAAPDPASASDGIDIGPIAAGIAAGAVLLSSLIVFRRPLQRERPR